MSTTTVRTTTMSSSYVPRNRDGSRPASPSMAPSYQPRSARQDTSRVASPTPGLATPKERAGSSLRHELKEVQVQKELKVVDEQTLQNARDILDLLSALPLPLSEELPPKVRSTPKPIAESARSFTDHVHSRSIQKRRFLELQEKHKEKENKELVGLGLQLESQNKRQKTSPDGLKRSPELARSGSQHGKGAMTPTLHSSRPPIKRGGSSTTGEPTRDKWSRERWSEEANEYVKRAVLCKRHGDAMTRNGHAKHEFASRLPHDPLSGIIALTDSMLLFLYSYWCQEQSIGRVRWAPYIESDLLRSSIRHQWEGEMRRSDIPKEQAEMNRGMVGLICLMEAMAQQQICVSQQKWLQARQREISAHPSSNPSTTPTSATHAVPPPTSTASTGGRAAPTGPSPSGSASPPDQVGPSPLSSNSSDAVSSDILTTIANVSEASNRSVSFLQASRFHLSLRVLREYFPKTYETAMSSDLSEEALPIPGDTVGSGRNIDPDQPGCQFAWPIELGMSAGMPHLVAFGRSMVEEYAEGQSLRWERKIAPF